MKLEYVESITLIIQLFHDNANNRFYQIVVNLRLN